MYIQHNLTMNIFSIIVICISLPLSQQPATCPYPELDKYSPRLPNRYIDAPLWYCPSIYEKYYT